MYINDIMKENNITKYRLSKLSSIPYSTLTDICNGKTDITKCSVETIYRLANGLNVSIDALIKPYLIERPAFELFKSNICHRLMELGDIDFLLEVLSNNEIRDYHSRKWYPECLYLLAMVDYLSRENDIPICEDYDDLRGMKLSQMLFPSGVIVLSQTRNYAQIKRQAVKEAIPEFIRFNIVENEVRNVN